MLTKRLFQVIDVDPAKAPGDNTERTDVVADEAVGLGGYLQVTIFDHTTRRKS